LSAYNTGPENLRKYGGSIGVSKATYGYVDDVIKMYRKYANPDSNDPIIREYEIYKASLKGNK
jgi:hypothetical protein